MKRIFNNTGNKKYIILFIFCGLVQISFSQGYDLNIQDGMYLNVDNGMHLKVKGDLVLGKGTSGNLNVSEATVNITGQFEANQGSELNLSNGTFFPGTKNLAASSWVFYSGHNDTVYNWNYSNLAIEGTGQMLITGTPGNHTECENLYVFNTGNSLNIPENKALTVTGSVQNNAGTDGIVVQSSNEGDGSLIIDDPNTDATVKRFITGNRWHYLSSPINNASRSTFHNDNFLSWNAQSEWTGDGDFSPWAAYEATALVNAHGYSYYYTENTIEFKGDINVDTYNVTLYKNASGNSEEQGWNLVGNPYSSSIDWDVAVADGAVPAGAENAVYFFDDNGDGSQANYRYYVPSTGGTYGIGTADAGKDIALGQGFFIKTNTNNVNLTLKPSYRNHFTQSFYKSTQNEILKMEVSSGKFSDEMIVRVVDEAGFDFDANYDARKLFTANEDLPQLYCITESSKQIAINSVPQPEADNRIILGFKAAEGEYDININTMSLSTDEVYLYDAQDDIYIDLHYQDNYSFSHSGGNNMDRFSIVFSKSTTETEHIKNNISLNIYPNPVSDFLVISTDLNRSNMTYEIFSLSGKVLKSGNSNDNKTRISVSDLSRGVYFVKLGMTGGQIYTEKIIKR